jgi:hypothetical protein
MTDLELAEVIDRDDREAESRPAADLDVRRQIRQLMAVPFTGEAAAALNFGDPPWKPHPAGAIFNPAKTALVYMFLDQQFAVHVTRVHFDAVTGGANEWGHNEARVAGWINYLNGRPPSTLPDPQDAPTAFTATLGLDDFAFNQPHHVVYYVKNDRVSYDEAFPVWFGDTLREEVLGVRVASRNKSFFEAEVYNVAAIATFSKKVIHMKNYYQMEQAGTYVPIVNGTNRLAYAININAGAQMQVGGWTLPLLIDPDTGNMGEGQP